MFEKDLRELYTRGFLPCFISAPLNYFLICATTDPNPGMKKEKSKTTQSRLKILTSQFLD